MVEKYVVAGLAWVTHDTGVAGLAEATFPGHLGRAEGTDSLAPASVHRGSSG